MCWVVLGRGKGVGLGGGGVWGYQPGVYVPLKALFLVYSSTAKHKVCKNHSLKLNSAFSWSFSCGANTDLTVQLAWLISFVIILRSMKCYKAKI